MSRHESDLLMAYLENLWKAFRWKRPSFPLVTRSAELINSLEIKMFGEVVKSHQRLASNAINLT